MSAEAPRNTGTGRPLPPQRSESGFAGFIRRLFVPGSNYQSGQPPVELGNLATRISEEVDRVQNIARHVESERLEKEKQEAERWAKIDESIEQHMNQLIRAGKQALEEITPVASNLRIRERLNYINANVWERKGEVRDISTPPGSITREAINQNSWRPQVGFELSYSYPTAVIESNRVKTYTAAYTEWRYVRGTETTYLRVVVKPISEPLASYDLAFDPNERRFVEIITSCSEFYIGKSKLAHCICIDLPSDQDISRQLDDLLAQESAARVRIGAIPSKLVLSGQESIRQAKATPHWMKWDHKDVVSWGGD